MKTRSFAVFCPIKNEHVFAKTWVKYYSQFTSNLYFLDFGSSPDYLSQFNCKVIKCDHDILDAWQLFTSIKECHRDLLKEYDYVIPTDVDEIIFTPRGLDKYINELAVPDVKCAGYEIIHLPAAEKDIDWSRNIFDQRKYWFACDVYYGKTLITSKPMDWTIGLHTCRDACGFYDPGLYLIHLHRVDYNTTMRRHLDYADLTWTETTIKNGFNWHYRLKDEKAIRQWYFQVYGEIVEIPKTIRDAIKV